MRQLIGGVAKGLAILAACALGLTLLGLPSSAGADPAGPTYTLTADETGHVVVGTPVLETYTALDADGGPITGVTVGFVRTGPGDDRGESSGATDEHGQVAYAYVGLTTGTATVEAMITDGSPEEGDQPVLESLATDQLVFVDADGGLIAMTLAGGSTGSSDRIMVYVYDIAAGLRAVLAVDRARRASHLLDEHGDHTFTTRDRNGNRTTKYTVWLAASEWTPRVTKSIRIR
ncbi:hypothetical protein [Nocardioides sp.]|uniref:hypothetical protein n=1 Tax=Nocardioides sp. TaxID=35761 RepID=UPI003783A337